MSLFSIGSMRRSIDSSTMCFFLNDVLCDVSSEENSCLTLSMKTFISFLRFHAVGIHFFAASVDGLEVFIIFRPKCSLVPIDCVRVVDFVLF